MFTLTLISFILFVISLTILSYLYKSNSDLKIDISIICFIISTLMLLGCILSLPISRYEIKDQIVTIKVFQLTIDQQRLNPDLHPEEYAGLTIKIAEKSVTF